MSRGAIRAAARKTLQQLQTSTAGLSAETIALIFALGLVLGVFPVFGAPTLLCSIAAILFRINLPAIQLVNQVSSPLQYALLIPLGRAGARIIAAPEVSASAHVGRTFIWNMVHSSGNAVVGWCCYCVPLGLVLYLAIAFALRRRRRSYFNERENLA